MIDRIADTRPVQLDYIQRPKTIDILSRMAKSRWGRIGTIVLAIASGSFLESNPQGLRTAQAIQGVTELREYNECFAPGSSRTVIEYSLDFSGANSWLITSVQHDSACNDWGMDGTSQPPK